VKVLTTGAGGTLAGAVAREFEHRGNQVAARSRAELDVTSVQQVADALSSFRPDVVVQCAAYTDVDGAEQEQEQAYRVNALAAGVVAEHCQRVGALFVYPSTDYVFSGDGTTPWKPRDQPDPVNTYGYSKWRGEQAARTGEGVLVVRTSWLYGEGGKNFVDTISRLALERDQLRVVDDQIGLPTNTATLASVIADLVEAKQTGIFHASDAGEPISWFDFARAVLQLRSRETEVVPVSTAAFPRPARRPSYSVLDFQETEEQLGRALPHWRDSLRRYLT
jgi:dTDP-4-dehydrorhamnose reductase